MKHLKLIIASLVLSYNSFGQACSQINTVTAKTLNSCNQTGTGHTNLNTLAVTQITSVGSFIGIDALIDTNVFQLKGSANTKFFLKPLGTGSQYIDGTGTLKTLPIGYTFTGTAAQVTTGNGSYTTLATVANTGDYNDLNNKPSTSYNSVSRTINSTSFTPSSTKSYRVYYNVSISCTASIGGAATGKVELQSFNGSTWTTIQEIANSNTVTLAITLNSVTVQTATLSAEITANTQLRLVPTSSGTTVISYLRGQEILY